MAENAFTKKDTHPDESLVEQKLKSIYSYLLDLRNFIKETLGETKEEWKFYGAKNGWLLKTYFKKRNLFFISVGEGYFKISFAFGDRAVEAVNESGISGDLKKELAAARKYAEGRELTVTVKDGKYLNDIKQLIKIKLSH